MVVEITTKENNPISASRAKEALQTIAKNLDVEMLEKVAKVSQSSKGRNLFKSKWVLIKSMI